MDDGIDFVVTWVDGSDPAWRAQKAHYSGMEIQDDRDERYRDWGIFRYWFRGVEKFAPWVRKVHFVTWGHLPEWLNVDHPKLHIVKHEDYIPEEFLPTFNSNVLEIYLHKIKGLAEHFVLFNDDMFLIRPMQLEDFFRAGKPCDMLALYPAGADPTCPMMAYFYLNNIIVLCKYFDKRENMRKQLGAYFHPGYPLIHLTYNLLEWVYPLYTRLYTVHGPSPFCKNTYLKIWEKEEQLLTKMSANRFRSREDVTQYLFREWQKLEGNFHPCNLMRDFKYFNISAHNQVLARTIARRKKKVICVNDTNVKGNYDVIREELQAAFQQILPEHSSFETH